jgi:hypothetical protein
VLASFAAAAWFHEVRWTGEAFLEDGTSVAGTGAGKWRKDPNGHVWHTDYIVEISDGTKIHSVGKIELSTLKFTGTNYSV